jgi:hypothetical protein
MKFLKLILPFLLASVINSFSNQPIPYSGKIAIRGVNYFGDAQFIFSLQDKDGNTRWRNGKSKDESIKVNIRNGYYTVLLGGQGMNALPPQLFLDYDELYLKVHFDNGDGQGLRHLAPDQRINATPRALVAEVAKIAKVAQVAEKVGNGAITREMLSQQVLTQLDANISSASVGPITREMLPASVLNDLNKTVSITRDMLPEDVRDDLNKTVTITRNMLPADVLSDLDRTISKSMLGSDVLTELSASIGMNRLSSEIRAKIDQNATVADGSVTGSKIAQNSVGVWQLNPIVMKYLKPEITFQPITQTVYADTNVSFSVTAEGKYLSYQWKKNGVDLTGETNATLNITDANATLHDGNYSVVVSNDFGSLESTEILLDVNTTWSTDGLVGWWKFDEGSGTVAYDSSGNEHDGNLTNGPTWTSGKIGGALSFDGSNDRVKLPHNILNGLIDVTVSFWFLESLNNTDHHHFISAASSTESNRILLALNSDGEFNYHDNDSSDIKRITYQYSESLTNWSHIVLTRSISGAKLFIGGSLKTNESFANTHFNIAQNGLWIGGDQDSVGGGWSTTQQLNGLLDDVRIYDRALSAAEVQALYNLGQ